MPQRVVRIHGTIQAAFDSAPPEQLAALYPALGVKILYDPHDDAVDRALSPWEAAPGPQPHEKRIQLGVRGGTQTHQPGCPGFMH